MSKGNSASGKATTGKGFTKPGELPTTGTPIFLSYSRNPQGASKITGVDYGQKIEPAGQYMNVDHATDLGRYAPPGWQSGYIAFNNPLVLEHKSTDSNGWKKDLSEMFGGKKGKSLSNAVKKAGYDAIITVDSEGRFKGINETVNLSGKQITADEFRRRNGVK